MQQHCLCRRQLRAAAPQPAGGNAYGTAGLLGAGTHPRCPPCQIVHMINEERATPMAAADAVACLRKRLNMEHPQKQFLAVVLTAKVRRQRNR